MTYRPKVLIIYDYFYPGYKAGGPVQSLSNLANALNNLYEIYVITSDRDMLSSTKYTGIISNQWNEVSFQRNQFPTQVFYTDKSLNRRKYADVITKTKAGVIYFNNIYSYYFFLLPLFALRGSKGFKIIVCPRGMLQRGALAVKSLKKLVYLTCLRFAGLLNHVYWHATDKQEANDIKKFFPKNKGVETAANIPKAPLDEIFYPEKKQGFLRLVFLSLIAEKKNLLLLLKVLSKTGSNVTLDIYGPITSNSYWQQCETLIKNMSGKVQYRGEVEPANVQQLLTHSHALILLTKGENFGHALYESLSAGRPVITSYFTPWNNLEQDKAGMNADIDDLEDCFEKLNKLAGMSQEEYNNYCDGAYKLAGRYYQNLNSEAEYIELFD